MPRLPQIVKFKGDNGSSFQRWCLQFEAQLKAFDIEDDNNSWRDLLLIYMEDNTFSIAAKANSGNQAMTYKELKALLESKFCGTDYKRALELKLRNLKFRKGTKIAPFVGDLKNTIQELYGIEQEEAVESIAVNHILSSLDDEMRKETKVLQLSGNAKLENILELVAEKWEGNALGLNVAAFMGSKGTTAITRSVENERLTKLESMMTNVMEKLDKLNLAQGGDAQAGRKQICEHCNQTGHNKIRCFKLKKCFHCGDMGHIAKFCKAKSNENKSALSSCDTSQEVAQISPGKRLKLKLQIGGQEFEFLYDPGSQFSIIPRCVYEKLHHRPPLIPVKESGVGVSGHRFSIDGIAHLNLKLSPIDGLSCTLEYEPVLVTAAVDTCIFGIKTELRFKETRRNQDMTFTFVTPESNPIKVACYFESAGQNNPACIKVARTTAVKDVGMTWVKGHIENFGAVRDQNSAYLLKGDDTLKTTGFFRQNRKSNCQRSSPDMMSECKKGLKEKLLRFQLSMRSN